MNKSELFLIWDITFVSFVFIVNVMFFISISLKWLSLFFNKVRIISCLIIALHHFLVYKNNWINLTVSSINKETACFDIFPASPAKSLDIFINRVKANDGRLETVSLDNDKDLECRLHEIYAAVAGACYWNKLDCPEIRGFDKKTETYIPLKTELWENYYLPH